MAEPTQQLMNQVTIWVLQCAAAEPLRAAVTGGVRELAMQKFADAPVADRALLIETAVAALEHTLNAVFDESMPARLLEAQAGTNL